MRNPLVSLILALFVLAPGARAESDGNGASATAVSIAAMPDSEQLEKGLQSLNWDQFKSVVTSIPKLKADVDAYGPLGWQYVEANYKTYRWKKNINKLNDTQKKELAALIQEAREGRSRLAE